MRFGTLTVVATLASSLILACDATGPDTDPQGQPGTVPSSLIAFFSAGDRSIYAVGPDGTGLHLIARGRPVRRSGNLSFSLPKWSPDGQSLAYLRYAGEDPGSPDWRSPTGMDPGHTPSLPAGRISRRS